jgi:hypothetical protein
MKGNITSLKEKKKKTPQLLGVEEKNVMSSFTGKNKGKRKKEGTGVEKHEMKIF